MTTDIAALGLKIESTGVERGVDSLEKLVDVSEQAEGAQKSLEKQSKATSQAVASTGTAAAAASRGLNAAKTAAAEYAKAEETAAARIKEMVKRSLEQQQAMLATASATREAAAATAQAQRSFSATGIDKLGNSFAAVQEELASFNDAMANEAQSIDDVGERREWLNELYGRGIVSVQDYEAAVKKLEKQERDIQAAISTHAREVQNLLRVYDPASAALRKITADELRLQEALRSGSITAQQYNKAIAGLQVNRARWQAEAQGIKETAQQLNVLGFTSAAAFRDYGTFVTALATGQFGLASRQILQVGIRTNALRLALTPIVGLAGAAAGVIGALAVASHQAQQENYELTKALTQSGNAAGVTRGQIHGMAVAIDEIVGTRAAAIETLTALAATGRVGADDLQEFGLTAQLLARNVGQPIEETIAIFKKLKDEPVEASIALNRELHYLTEEVEAQIIALAQRGEIDAAGALAQDAYASAARRRAEQIGEDLPTLTAGAKKTAGAFKEMWDTIQGLFVTKTPEDRLAELRAKRQATGRELGGGRRISDDADDVEETRLAAIVQDQERAAGEAREAARATFERERARRELTQRLQSERAIADAVSSARASNIQRELGNSLAQYAAYETQLEAQRQANLVSEEIYYDEKRKLIEQNRDVQIEALEAENARIAADSARIRAQANAEKAGATNEPEKLRIEAAAQTQVIANQNKIADNEAKLAQLRGEAIAQLNVLTIEQVASNKAITDSYNDARDAAQRYLDVIIQQQRRELEGMGQGDRQREIDATRGDIDDRFAEQRLALAGERRRNEITQEQYDRQLGIINEFHQKALNATDTYFNELAEKESSWMVGAREAWSNYRDNALNVARSIQQAVESAFDRMEDAIVDFVMTGKGDFKELAQSIIADLLRIQIRAAAVQIFASLGSALSGLFAPTAVGGIGAGGGTVPTAGAPLYADTGIKRVERDNQPAILHKDEAVIPAAMNPYAGGTWAERPPATITMNLYPAPGTDNGQFQAMLTQAKGEILNEVFESFHRQRFAA